MAQDLRLQVMLNAVDRVTGPLKRIRQGAGQTGQAMRETRDRLKELQRTQSDLTSYRKANAALRTTTRAMRDARARNQQYTQALERQREAHASIKSGLTVARREYDRLAREMLNTKQPSDQLSASLERARVRLHGQQTEFDRSARAMREYRNRTRNADEEVKKLTRNHATQTERIRGLKTRLDEAGISTDNLGRSSRELRTKEDRLNTTLQEQKRHLTEVAERQRRLTQARDRYQNGMANVARAQGVGMGMFGTGIAQGYAASRLLTPGVAWGEQMSTLQAVGRFSADDERYQALREQSRELGGSTAFSATEVGGGQEFLLRAGMSAEAIQASMRDVLDLALANNTELARAADIASNIAGTFKIDMEADGAMARVADILSGTASRANVNLEMLGETMKYLGGSEDLDLTMEQAAAMAGLMGNIGIQGSMAGTAMRAMANRLTDPAKAGRDAMEQLGLQVSDANGNMRDMPDILRDINNATRDLGNVERRALLSKIFGAEAGSGMTELVNGMADGDLDELINALQTNAGENAEMARVMADNLGGDLKSLRSAWEEVGISITDTNDGPLRELVQTIAAITRGVGEWIKANPELAGTIAKVAAGMIALATVGGAVTMTFASILSPLLFAKFAMTTLGIKVGGLGTALGWIAKTAIPWVAGALKGLLVAMGPIGWGIAAIAGAAFLIYKFWEPIKAFFVGLWQQVKAAFDEGVGGVARLLINWSPLGLIHSAFIGALDLLGISVPEGFRNLGGFVIDGLIGGLGDKLVALRERITSIGNSIADWFKGVLGIHSPSRVFEGFGINIVEGMINGITGMAGALRDHVTGLASNIAGWMSDAVGSAWDAGRDMAASIGSGIADGARAAGRAARDAGGAALDTGRDIASGMANGIRDGARGALSAVRGMAQGTENAAREQLDTNSPSRVFRSIGNDVANGLNQGISRGADGPIDQVRSLTDRLRGAAAGLMLGVGIASPAIALEVEAPTLPELPNFYSEIATPEMPRLMSEVATPETPTLDALRIERPTLPALSELGALQIQPPTLPALPTLYIEVTTPDVPKPEIPTLDALRIEHPTLPALPSLGALEIQQPALPEIPTLYSEVTTPEIPTLDALRIEQPTLPALPSLGALQIQQPALPEMPRLMSEVATPETPILDALHIEQPTLPSLPSLGALEIQQPALPQMPRLMSEVATPETPTLDALHIERPTLPALPSLGALEIQQPTLPALPTLYSEVATPETPTLDALRIEQPTLPALPSLGALEIHVPEIPRLMSEVATPEIPTLDAMRIKQPTLPALPSLGAFQIQRPELPSLDTQAFEWPELPQFDPLRIDTSGVQIDARPPLQSHTSQPSSGLVINGGINIEINAAPGMDEQALARLVNAEVQRALRDAERRAQASRRSAFHDID